MQLTELSPRWVNDERTVFVFQCPCPKCQALPEGERVWISCKSVPMTTREQFELFMAAKLRPTGRGADVVPMRADTCWSITGDFADMRVTPSIDASASGHWHGHIGSHAPGAVV